MPQAFRGLKRVSLGFWQPRQASAALRPGIAVGPYPEHEDTRDGWLDRTAAGLAGFIRQYAQGRHPQYRRFVAKVNEQSTGLSEMSEADIKERVLNLRRRLYSEGFEEALATQVFAVTRELASRRLGLRHHDVQLFGGWVMLNGKVAEMATGEGKTLAATLPAATVAMAGIPVHIVTVNDFLVARDATWMQPLYHALGLTVGTITENMDPDQRRAAYACDITYCTNKQLVFDYLKDRLLLGSESRRLHLQLESLHNEQPRSSRLLLRGLCFAIVDEADSVLVDEARTPLIISSPGDLSDQESAYKEAVRIARSLQEGRDFTLRQQQRQVDLTDAGKAFCARLARSLGGVWKGGRRRESLIRQALSGVHFFIRNKHYLVTDGKVQIVDEYTGRIMADRSWEGGLHQMIQAKEGCEITGRQETLARISYQRFFRRYLRLAGMTGTAREVARELWSVYRLNIVTIPTDRPVRRTLLANRVHGSADARWTAVLQSIDHYHQQGRPVLVGTRSVESSEHLSELLSAAQLPHVVLNARQNQDEAEIVAQAGGRGRITVATNMAGRGTDIRLAPGVVDLGGLHVIATERHDSRRIDRQLFGRCGRQGDPGSCQAIVSLEDELVKDCYGETLLSPLSGSSDKPLPGLFGYPLVAVAQWVAENRHSRIRGQLLRVDDNLSDMLAFSGRGE